MTYWIDDFGSLWSGPHKKDKDGNRYGRFDGWEKGQLVWRLESECILEDWEEIPHDLACRIVDRFFKEEK